MVTLGLPALHDFHPALETPKQCRHCGYGKWNTCHDTGRKVHKLDIPTEPPAYAVVIDKELRAWQAIPTAKGAPRWHVVPKHPLVIEAGSSLLWTQLLERHGPVTEVFRLDRDDIKGAAS
jgi:hypothetical protein